MLRKYFIYIVFACCTSLVLNNPLMASTDSLVVNNLPENYNYSFLNLNPFNYDRILSPLQFDSLQIPTAGTFRFSATAFDLHLNRPFFSPDPDTNFAASNLRILLGSTREQLVFVDHAQHLSKKLSATIHYHSIVSPGFLLNCLSREKDFAAALNYNASFLKSEVSFRYGKIDADENGGIPDSVSVNGLSRSEFEQIKTLATDENRVVRQYLLSWNNFIPMFSLDSSATKIGLLAGVEWYRWGTSYSGVAEKNLYSDFFVDSTATDDTCGMNELRYVGGVHLESAAAKWQWSADAGVKLHSNLKWKVLDSAAVINYSEFFASAKGVFRSYSFSADMHTVSSSSANNGDVSFSADLNWKSNAGILSYLGLDLKTALLAVPLTNNFYRSNHFEWNNDFSKENYLYYRISSAWLKNQLSVSASSLTVNNMVYFNGFASPVQADDVATINRIDLNGRIKWRKWNLLLMGRYTTTNAGFIKLPELSGWTRLSYTARFFKKALLAEFGTSFYGTTGYKGYAYMPATSAFYVQNEWNTGGWPVMDVFVNAGIGKATLSLTYQRINSLFTRGEYYLAAGYPGAPSTIKFSVNWPLIN